MAIPAYYLPFKTAKNGLQVGCLQIVVPAARTCGDRHWDIMFLQMMDQFMHAWQKGNCGPEGL